MDQAEPAPRHTTIARMLLGSALALLGLWIISSFVPALIWAVIIAVAIDPIYVRATRRWPGHDGLLAAGITLGIALVVIVPAGLGIAQAFREAYDVANWMSSARTNGVPVPSWISELPFGSSEVAGWWQENLATPQGAAEQLHRWSGATLLAHSRLIGNGLIHRAIIFAFTLIVLFFLLRDRVSIVHQCRLAGDRLFGAAGERIGHQAIRSIRGTIDGVVLVGIGEGVVMTVVYELLGVPHPLLLGVLTAIAAMIPFGAALLFVIAALLLLGKGAISGAIAVVVIGLVVVGIADHFVRPVLIGSATSLPFVWVLIGILGGVETLGLLGLFVGPATMAVLILLWREFLHGSIGPGSAASADGTPAPARAPPPQIG